MELFVTTEFKFNEIFANEYLLDFGKVPIALAAYTAFYSMWFLSWCVSVQNILLFRKCSKVDQNIETLRYSSCNINFLHATSEEKF